MSKLAYLASAFILLFSSCSDEEIVKNSKTGMRIYASFEESTTSSRMAVGENNTLRWTEGDAFFVFGANSTTLWTLEENENTEGAFSTEEIIPTDDLMENLLGAAYPASIQGEKTQITNGSLTINLADKHTYDANGGCNLPMWAPFTSFQENIHFKHLGAMLKINMQDIPVDYNTILVQADQPLAGPFWANIYSEEPILAPIEDSNLLKKEVSISFVSVDDSPEDNDRIFYMPIPVNTYGSLQVFLSNGENKISMASWRNVNIMRNKIYLASLIYKVSEATTPEEIGNDLTEMNSELPTFTLNIPNIINTTPEEAGEVEIPKSVENGPKININFEQPPVTTEDKPLVFAETENLSASYNMSVFIPKEKESFLTLSTPNATIDLLGGNFNKLTSETAKNTLIVGSDVIINNLEINAGNVVLHGKITGSIKRGANNKDVQTHIHILPEAILDPKIEIGENILFSYSALNNAEEILNLNLDNVVSQLIKYQGLGGEPAFMIVRDAMADDMAWTRNGYYQPAAKWEHAQDASNINNYAIWGFYYDRIKEANQILEILENIKEEYLSTEDLVRFERIKGEALCIRASNHFHLVQLYANRYIGNQNNSQKGIAYHSSTDANHSTVSVEKVYSLINQDLEMASTLLKDKEAPDAEHYTQKVSLGLQARVALTMQNYAMAANYAEQAITEALNDGNKLMTGEQLYNGFADITTKTQEAMQADLAKASVYYYSYYAFMSWNCTSSSVRQGVKCINADTYNTLSETDMRRAWWDPTGDEPVPSGSFIRNPYQNRKFTARTDDLNGEVAFMRLAEMYLIQAEAEARQGNEAKAQEVFTLFQKTRDPQYASKGNTGDALITEIMNSRRVELWGEGFRFYDLKRLNLPIKRSSNFDTKVCGFLEKEADANGWTWVQP